MKKKERKPRKCFAERLADKLKHLGEIEVGELGDDSGSWVNLRVGSTEINFSFDPKGELIDRIGVYEDVVEVTGQDQIFSTK